MQQFSVTGGSGVKLSGREWGNPDGPPLILIHGWSQAWQSWTKQRAETLSNHFRIVAYDLRGHGGSDKPDDPEQYNNGRLWAEDLAAVIQSRSLQGAVLVGWSYGGLVICDYLAEFGTADIAGINYVCAATQIGESSFGIYIGEGLLEPYEDAVCDDTDRNILGMRRFIRNCMAMKISREDYETCLCFNMLTPASVRGFTTAREANFDELLGRIDIPVLATQGLADTIVLPAMSRHTVALCPNARLSEYDGVGHSPFIEAPERFNQELADFVNACQV